LHSGRIADITRNEEDDAMSTILRVGALFMQAGTFVSRSLGVETEACSPGWKWITNLDGNSFDRNQVIVWGH
jgi:hypothetical protein